MPLQADVYEATHRTHCRKNLMIPPPQYFNFIFLLFRTTPGAYESSQAKGSIGAAAAGLHHSHSNTRSELHL